jgi:hypothetical protein
MNNDLFFSGRIYMPKRIRVLVIYYPKGSPQGLSGVVKKKDAPYLQKGCTRFRKRMHPFFKEGVCDILDDVN